MPYTPYHFGPSSLIGLLLRKWIDFPVFVLANIIMDLERLVVKLLFPGRFVPRYAHTFLLSAAVGIIWGAGAYFFRGFFKRIMDKIQIPYKTSISKMIFSGIFGAWVHLSTDALYRPTSRLFWPFKIINPLSRFNKEEVELICVLCFIAAFVVYVWILNKKLPEIPEESVEKRP